MSLLDIGQYSDQALFERLEKGLDEEHFEKFYAELKSRGVSEHKIYQFLLLKPEQRFRIKIEHEREIEEHKKQIELLRSQRSLLESETEKLFNAGSGLKRLRDYAEVLRLRVEIHQLEQELARV